MFINRVQLDKVLTSKGFVVLYRVTEAGKAVANSYQVAGFSYHNEPMEDIKGIDSLREAREVYNKIKTKLGGV